MCILNMALNLIVKVHPVVLFQVVDAYERRKAESLRVVGTLLGNVYSLCILDKLTILTLVSLFQVLWIKELLK